MKPVLKVHGNYLRYTHPDDRIRTLLTNRRNTREGGETIVVDEPLYEEVDGTIVSFAGLLPRIRKHLDITGVDHDLVDEREAPPEVDYSRIPGQLNHGQPEAIAAVTTSSNGVVKLPTANGKTHVIGILTELYRGVSRVMIVSENSGVIRTIMERVKTLSGSKAYVLDKDTEMNPKVDCIVCSAKSLHKMDPDWPEIILYDEVHSSAAPVTGRRLMKFHKARFFGFSATPTGRSDSSELVTEALFGPIRVNVSYNSSVDAGVISPIRVYMLPVPVGGGDASSRKTDAARDRNGIWRNRTRNSIIAEAVKNIPDSEQVLILAQTSEHVFRLRKLLPDWPVAHGGLTKKRWGQFLKWGLIDQSEGKEVWKPDVNRLEKDFASGRINRVISTGVWKEGVDFPNLNFVVRVDGKRGMIPSIQMGGRLSRKGDKGKKMGILLDFEDDFDSLFNGRAKDRARRYRKEGWEVRFEYPDFDKLMTEIY